MLLSTLVSIAVGLTNNDLPIRAEGKLCHPRRLFVHAEGQEVESRIERVGVKIINRLPQIDYLIVETQPGTLLSSKAKLKQIKGVGDVSLDIASRLAYDPNDPLWPNQWHTRAINAHTAWDLSLGSTIIVAVIDTGVEVTHPDLAANMWVNTGEIPGNNLDDDGNGYKDDVNGYDFAYNDSNPNDVYGHGTPCSGIVAAVQDNNIGCTGVAPRAKIMALKTSIDSGYLYDSANVPAYLYAADNGARVLSMSYFSDDVTPAGRAGIDYSWRKGVIPCAAAGNSDSVIPYYPACYENCIAVAALDGSLGKAGFSNYGVAIDVAAPGVSLTTITTGGGYTGGFGGTSGATPHVAGSVALIWGAAPSKTNLEVRAALEDTATLINQAPWGEFSNYGLVNCRLAMEALMNSPASPKPAKVNYVTPAGQYATPPAVNAKELVLAKVYGRGFQSPNTVEIWKDGQKLPIRSRGRDVVQFLMPPGRGNLIVKVNGLTVKSFMMPVEQSFTYGMVEAGTYDASISGGYFETLNPDSLDLTCTRRPDGRVYVESTIRGVKPTSGMKLILNRRYTNGSGGTERVYIYNWNSFSYPYGNWTLVSTAAAPIAEQRLEINVPSPKDHVDDEGVMYVVIDTDGLPGGAVLRLNQMNLVRS